jgi:transposase
LLFAAMLMAMIPAMPVAAAARTLGEHGTTLWRAVHHYVGQGRAWVKASSVTRAAIDAAHSQTQQNQICA